MNIQIGEKKYELYLGFDFIRYLDKAHELEIGLGLDWGVGVGQVMRHLESGNPLGILSVIQAGTCTLPEDERPTEKDVEEFIEANYKKKGLDKLFLDLKNLLKGSAMTSPCLAGYQSVLESFQQLVRIGMEAMETEKKAKQN